MPFLVLAEVEAPPDEEDVVGGAAAALEEDVVGVAAGAGEELDELEELEPQAATARATRLIASGARRRIEGWVFEFMSAPSDALGEAPAVPLDAREGTVVPTPSRLVVLITVPRHAQERRK
jgi:hypothetical protein